jgi:hypothetical protein
VESSPVGIIAQELGSVLHSASELLQVGGECRVVLLQLLPCAHNYRTVQQVLPKVFLSRSYNVSGGLSYRNLISLFFANINVGYSTQKVGRYFNFDYTDSLTTVAECEGTTTSHRFIVNSELSKSFASAGITLKWTTNYSQNRTPLSQNGILYKNRSHVLASQIDFDFHKLKWLRFYLKTRASFFWERSSTYHSPILSQFTNETTLYLFPSAKWDFRVHMQGTSNEVESSVFKHCYFVDAEAHWKMNKMIELNCSLRNLMNATSYSVTQVSGHQYNHQTAAFARSRVPCGRADTYIRLLGY